MKQLLINSLLLLTALIASAITPCFGQCPNATLKGNDFWVTFLYNQNISVGTTLDQRYIIATGDQTCTVNINNSNGLPLNAVNGRGSCQFNAGANVMQVAQPYNGAYHVTSSEDIWLYARNLVNNTEDIAVVVPTSGLSTRYIVQDYPATEKGGEVAFVATEDGTVLTMTVPCDIRNTSITAGTTLTVNLNMGQAYMLMTNDVSASFSGMVVTSNNKPFAMFQGAWNPAVPETGSGRDHMYEQAVGPEYWGTEFVVAGVSQQNGSNRVRITSSEDSCVVVIGNSTTCTLNENETHEFTLWPSSAVQISTTKPVYVVLYLGSYQGNTIGDPSSVAIPPLNRGICEGVFTKVSSSEIYNHYVTIICHQMYDAGMQLNGAPLPSNGVTTIGDYKVHRLSVSEQTNSLTNTNGPYIAYCYGLGSWISYAYLVGMALDTTELPEPPDYDTVTYYDTICVGTAYSNYGFNISAAANNVVGNRTFERDELTPGLQTHYTLYLTVLPTAHNSILTSFAYGDTVFFCDTAITQPGTYTFRFTAANGCDSIVTLELEFQYDTIALYDTICAGSPYDNNGFSLSAQASSTPGDTILERRTIEASVPTLYLLRLTILPLAETDTSISIISGDTLYFADSALSLAGTYTFHFTGTNGCDSTITLHLSYEAVGLTTSADGICPGDEVVLTASGTHTFIWSSSPYDPELDSQQGNNPVTVHPTVTTEYRLLDPAGNILSSIVVGTEPPPVVCIHTNRDFIDFDFPKVVFDDCSEGRFNSTWQFSDGVIVIGSHTVRKFNYPLPDSVVVTLTSCNRYNCCSDTTITLPCRIRSFWFPNVFTPDAETNNIFRPFTSRNIIEFELIIYNRWGLQVWKSTDIEKGWDGRRSDGTVCTQDAYVFHWFWRDADGDTDTGTGMVTLLR